MISYNGWIVHSNCYNYFQKNINPYINITKCKKIIKNYICQKILNIFDVLKKHKKNDIFIVGVWLS